jgi:hypothetical protein
VLGDFSTTIVLIHRYSSDWSEYLVCGRNKLTFHADHVTVILQPANIVVDCRSGLAWQEPMRLIANTTQRKHELYMHLALKSKAGVEFESRWSPD